MEIDSSVDSLLIDYTHIIQTHLFAISDDNFEYWEIFINKRPNKNYNVDTLLCKSNPSFVEKVRNII